MATKTNSGKLVAFILVALIGAAAGFGYFKQASMLSDSDAKPAGKPSQEMTSVLAVKPNDIIVGDANALVTIVEYSSLSCSHCAHFHNDVLPTLEKEFITTGKVKLVLRHFPLNAPAMQGSMLVECAGQNGLNRANFMKTLFEMQPKWAFDEGFSKNLQQIGRVGGLDTATFESCLKDKTLENQILASRKEGEEVLKIDGTPSFFIDGVAFEGERTAEGFRAAIQRAMKADTQANTAPAPAEAPQAAPVAEKPAAAEVQKAPKAQAEQPAEASEE